MPGFDFGFTMRGRRRTSAGGAIIPDGALTDHDGALLLDDDGFNLIEEN